jgi:hypothetical protein
MLQDNPNPLLNLWWDIRWVLRYVERSRAVKASGYSNIRISETTPGANGGIGSIYIALWSALNPTLLYFPNFWYHFGLHWREESTLVIRRYRSNFVRQPSGKNFVLGRIFQQNHFLNPCRICQVLTPLQSELFVTWFKSLALVSRRRFPSVTSAIIVHLAKNLCDVSPNAQRGVMLLAASVGCN